MAERTAQFARRIESFSVDTVLQRLARTLIGFAERFGTLETDGYSVNLPHFTQQFLADYVGTSREIVTHYMNQFRRMALLRYSRRGITIHKIALQNWLSGTVRKDGRRHKSRLTDVAVLPDGSLARNPGSE
jgi:CRP-like cAMP-binding protein